MLYIAIRLLQQEKCSGYFRGSPCYRQIEPVKTHVVHVGVPRKVYCRGFLLYWRLGKLVSRASPSHKKLELSCEGLARETIGKHERILVLMATDMLAITRLLLLHG